MKQSLYRGLFACLSLSVLASCQDYDGGFSEEQIKKAAYDKHFEKTFGKVDPNQDWSMAQQVTAAINVPQVKGNAKVYLFDGIPNDPAVHILAENEMNGGKAAFRFDALKGVKSVYVAVMQEGKSVFSGTFSVDKSTLAIGEVKDMLAEMEMSQVLTRSFSPSCPTTIKDVKEDLFTNIVSDVSKYKFNDKFYTLAELRVWAQTEYEAGRVTVDNYLTKTPFTSSCFVDGQYDFSTATLKGSVVGPTTEAGYLYNSTYFANIDALRTWAAGLADVTTTNYMDKTPFTNSCVAPAGYDLNNPDLQINESKVTEVTAAGYFKSINGTVSTWSNLAEMIQWTKDNEPQTQAISGNNSQLLINVDWDGESLNYDRAEIKPEGWGGPKSMNVGDYIFNNWVYTLQGLKDYVTTNKDWILNNGPFSNCYLPEHLNFSTAVLDESKVTSVPAGSYIYNNQVFASLDALKSYTTDNKLGNNGPFDNCCSASDLDFSSATVDESKAPLTPVTFDIDLTYLSNVETEAATPWTRGWGYSLYGPKGFFMEQCNYFGAPDVGNMAGTFNKYTSLYGSTDSERRELLDKIEAGFKIKSKGGVIELPFVYGATSIVDQFGYVFYKDGEDPLQQPHYILMEDGRPDVNLYLNSWQNGAASGWTGTSMSTWITQLGVTNGPMDLKDNPISCYCHNPGIGKWSVAYGLGEDSHDEQCAKHNDPTAECEHRAGCNPVGTGVYSPDCQHVSSCNDPMKNYLSAYNEKCYGTKYRLVYFDEHGNGTYDIPAGLNIAFFICPVSSVAGLTSREGYNVGNFHYSLPELNKRIKHYYYNTGSPSYVDGNSTEGSPNLRGAVKACAWKQDGMTFLGFEDGGNDEDLNDIVFWVEGEFETNDIVELYPVKWHMNLNGVHDENDGDLFAYTTLKEGDAYSQPSSNPKRDGYVFKGWAISDAQGTPISGSTTPGTIHGTMGTEGICYFAIWEPVTVMPDTYTVKWHLNYSMTGHLTDDSDLFASTPGLLDGAAYDSPASNPSVGGKVFRGWSTTYNNADNDATLNPIHGTIQSADVCYFAIWSDPVINYQSWIFACEDLGGTFDYDFNDVVWEVKRTNNEGVTSTKLRLLAAGGTLPFTLYYDGVKVCTKQDAFGTSSTPINAGSNTTIKPVQEYDIADKDWSVVENYKKFSVAVDGGSGTTWVTAYDMNNTLSNKTPQVIILPGEWEWPTETTPIDKAYPSFTNWVTNGAAVSWSDWNAKKTGPTCKYN